MLFSEPKIPQSAFVETETLLTVCFSALQRAENSSMQNPSSQKSLCSSFQCSSASRKFLNCSSTPTIRRWNRFQCSSASRKFLKPYDLVIVDEIERFSALQRAENSSIAHRLARADRTDWFQCSSASRKFLNQRSTCTVRDTIRFQCSSASRKFLNRNTG